MTRGWTAHLLPSGMVIWMPPLEVTYGTAVVRSKTISIEPEPRLGVPPYVTASWRRVAGAS